VFLVDFVRPAAGTLDMAKIEFDSEQYFANVEATVKEETIKDIKSAIDTLKGAISGAQKSSEKRGGLTVVRSVVAIQRFDISEPDWEMQLQTFVESHLGACRPAGESRTPGGALVPALESEFSRDQRPELRGDETGTRNDRAPPRADTVDRSSPASVEIP
jgi:hypothetical protein